MTTTRAWRHGLMIGACLVFGPGCGWEAPTSPAEARPAETRGRIAAEVVAVEAGATRVQGAPIRREGEALVVVGLTVDAEGGTVIPVLADPATPLWYRRDGRPILAPDGSQVTAGEFSAARGRIDVTCVESGTHIRLHLNGLIPEATYRVWLLTFREPGFDIGPPPDFSNLTGEGALGPADRTRNTFRASASGEGQITRIHPAGAMSETLPSPPFVNEPAGSCLPRDAFEWHVVGAFQQPGAPAGPDVGPPALYPGTAVEHFTFNLRGG